MSQRFDEIGNVSEYADLRALIAARRKQLGLSQLALDDIAGTQQGYTAKIECGTRHFGDVSFGCILGALGIEFAAVRTGGTHGESGSAPKASSEKLKIVRKNLAAKGGRARAAKLSADQRRRSAQKAAKSRWRNWREVKAAKEEKERRAARRAEAKQDAP